MGTCVVVGSSVVFSGIAVGGSVVVVVGGTVVVGGGDGEADGGGDGGGDSNRGVHDGLGGTTAPQ